MSVHLITGYAGKEHIQSKDTRSFNRAMFGNGEFVMEAGNQLEASILDNNTVRILDGDILMQGGHIRIDANTYEDLTITTGTAGTSRIDLIVMTYSKDLDSGIESAYLEVIQGTESEGTPSEPTYTTGNLESDATFNQMPLYQVNVVGVVLTSVKCLFTTIPTYKTLAEQYAAQFQKACETYIGALNILDTMEEVEANTLSNQLAGALALKEINTQHVADFNTHKISGDHDSRYYTKSGVNSLLSTHKTSGDHDSRYYQKSAVDTLLKNKPSMTANSAIQHGRIVISDEVPANGYLDVDISFETKYLNGEEVTVVTTLKVDSGSSANWSNVIPVVRSVTQTGATVRILNSNSTAFSPYFLNWVACGKT